MKWEVQDMVTCKKFMTVALDTFRKLLPFSIAYWVVLLYVYPVNQLSSDMLLMINNTVRAYMESERGVSSNLYMCIPVSGVAMLFSTVAAFIAFSYFHNKRRMDFVGALPVTRRTQFFGRMAAVVFASVIPVIIVTFIGSAIYGFSYLAPSCEIMGRLILGIVSNIAFVGLISVCSGTVAHTILSYLIINVLCPIFALMCYFYPSWILPGITTEEVSPVVVSLLSPFAAPFCSYISKYTNMFFDTDKLGSSDTMLYVIWWCILTILLIAVSFVLVKRRKTESAQNSFAFTLPEIIVRLFSTITIGWLSGIIFSSVVDVITQKTIISIYIVTFMIGFVTAAFIAHLLLHLIYHKGMNGFVRWLILLGVELIVGTGLFFFMITGLGGCVTNVPNVDDVEKVNVSFNDSYFGEEFYVDGKNILNLESSDKDVIEKTTDAHRAVTDALEEKSGGLYVPYSGDYSAYTPVLYDEFVSEFRITYTMKDGSSIVRVYNENNLNMLTSDAKKAIADLQKSFDYKIVGRAPLNKCSDFSMEVQGFGDDILESGYYDIYDDSVREKLIENINKDYEEVGDLSDEISKELWDEEEYTGNGECAEVNIEYSDGRGNIYSEYIIFNSKYKNTMNYLKSIDLGKYCY